MVERPAVNASPLILLTRADLLSLLQVAGERLVVPEPVAREIERHGPEDVTARAIRTTPWLERVEAPKTPSVVEAWDLGIVPAARPLIGRLREAGLFLSQRVVDDSLALVGE